MQSVAFRTLFLLGINQTHQDQHLPQIDVEIRHRLFWHCYIFDRYTISMSAAVPPQILDSHCKVPMPMSEVRWEKTGFQTNFTPWDPEASFYTHLVPLSRIGGMIGDLNTKEKQTTSRYDPEYQMLDSSLRNWFVLLPMHFQYPGDTFASDWWSALPHWSVNLLHVLYHTFQILLRKSRTEELLKAKPPINFVTNSKEFSICFSSSHSIAQICRVIRVSNPLFLYLCRFTIFCRFQAGNFLKTLLDIEAKSTSPYFPSDIIADCQRDLEDIIATFAMESRHSWITTLFVNKLRGIEGKHSIEFYTQSTLNE
jgi:hypothetical protein